MMSRTWLEFFSGIGAFASAAARFDIRVMHAFDQSSEANAVYGMNHGLMPISRNLDSIAPEEIPDAHGWWLSPPCRPYSRRGKQGDIADPRAGSFVNLMRAMEVRKPPVVIVENVVEFGQSEACALFLGLCERLEMNVLQLDLCPTNFGIPMRRPRRFIVAARATLSRVQLPPVPKRLIHEFLRCPVDPELFLDADLLGRYGRSLHIIEPDDPDAVAICFTSNYWKCMRAAGSYLRESDGDVRRFSPEEIISLLGFGDDFRFPPDMSLRARTRLAGNSVHLHCIIYLLQCLGYTSDVSRNHPGTDAPPDLAINQNRSY